jgi:hypothetical protein
LTAGDISNLTHVRGLDGTTISRADIAATNQMFVESTKELEGLIDQLIRALEQVTPTEPLPAPPGAEAVNIIGQGTEATVRAHIAALRLLSEEPFLVEVGPWDKDWLEWVVAIGSWVAGEVSEVDRFVMALSRRVPIVAIPWQERG